MAWGSRAFVSASSQGLQSSALALSSYNQLSISFWLKWTAFANDDKLAIELGPNTNSTAGTFFIDPDSTTFAGLVQFTANMSGTSANASISRPSAGVWHHWLAILDMSQSTDANIWSAIYIDGVAQSKGNNAGAGRTPTNLTNQPLNFMCRNQASLFADGSMADVAIWAASSGNRGGALLTASEAKALAQGARPGTIRQSSLAYWWPIDGLQSPEEDLGGTAKNLTLTNAPAPAFGPPYAPFTPRWPQFIPSPAVIATRRIPNQPLPW